MISVNQKRLLTALKLAKGIVNRKATMPVLSTVLLTAKDGTLTVCSTDLSETLTTAIPALGELSACVELSALLSAVEAASPKGKDSTVTIDASPGSVKVTGVATMAVKALDAADFPASPSPVILDTITYDGPSLLNALAFVVPAVSTDETRYHLNGVLLNDDKMVSTDGHRLHMQSGLPSTGGASYLIPRKGAVTLAKLLKGHKANAVGAFGGGFARFAVGDSTLTVKLIDAQFPPYEQVIPNKDYCESGFTAKRVEFLSAVKAAAAMSSDRTNGVRLNATGGELYADCDNPDVGEVKAAFPGLSRKAGEPWRIGVNAKYITEAVEVLDSDTVTLINDGPLEPMRIDDGDRTAVVMPMRI